METAPQPLPTPETLPETQKALPTPLPEIPARTAETHSNSFGPLAGIIIIIIILVIGALYFWGATLSSR